MQRGLLECKRVRPGRLEDNPVIEQEVALWLQHGQDNSARSPGILLYFTSTPWHSFALGNHVEITREFRRRRGTSVQPRASKFCKIWLPDRFKSSSLCLVNMQYVGGPCKEACSVCGTPSDGARSAPTRISSKGVSHVLSHQMLSFARPSENASLAPSKGQESSNPDWASGRKHLYTVYTHTVARAEKKHLACF